MIGGMFLNGGGENSQRLLHVYGVYKTARRANYSSSSVIDKNRYLLLKLINSYFPFKSQALPYMSASGVTTLRNAGSAGGRSL